MTIQTDLFDEMLAEVYSLTARPDMVSETTWALRTATTNAHLSDAYAKDRVTVNVQLPNTTVQAAIDVSTALPGLRGISTIRPLDINQQILYQDGWGNAPMIEIVEAGDIYDPEYKNIKPNIAYISGDKLIIRYPISIGGYVIEYLKAPQTKRELYNSWIAQECPAIIVLWAAANVFSMNGNQEKTQSLLTQIEKFYIPQLKQNYLLTAVH